MKREKVRSKERNKVVAATSAGGVADSEGKRKHQQKIKMLMVDHSCLDGQHEQQRPRTKKGKVSSMMKKQICICIPLE